MEKSIEISARTEEEAIQAALEQLGLAEEDVSVEIIQMAKSGFLGLKNVPAIIRVRYEEKDGRVAIVEKFLAGLLKRMAIEAEIEAAEVDNTINVVLTGKTTGLLIGRRGETLDAVQHLTNYVINRKSDDRVRVNLDTENYRQRRNTTLETLAGNTADKVIKSRKSISLETMNAYERHVIHSTLQERENVTTYSIGSEPNRRVVVAFGSDKDRKFSSDKDRKDRYGRDNRAPKRSSRPYAPAQKKFENPPPTAQPKPEQTAPATKNYREWS